jgi:hypothetical protein
LEAPGDDEKTILNDAAQDTIPDVEGAEGNTHVEDTQAEYTGASDDFEGTEV